MRKIHVTLQFFGVPFSKKQKKNFEYGQGECVYPILGLYRFPLGQEVLVKVTKWKTAPLTWI